MRKRNSSRSQHMTRLLVLCLACCLCVVGCRIRRPLPKKVRPLRSALILQAVETPDMVLPPIVDKVEIYDAGLYEPLASPVFAEDDACFADTYRLVRKTTFVPAQLMQMFGFKFTLSGSPGSLENGDPVRSVPLSLLVHHPAIENPVTGDVSTLETVTMLGCLEGHGTAVWQFTSDWELVNGQWLLELQYMGKTLAKRTFVVEQGRVSHVPQAPEIQQRPQELTVRLKGAKNKKNSGKKAVATRSGSASGIRVLVSSNIYEQSALDQARELRAKGYSVIVGSYFERKTQRTWHTVQLGNYPSVRAARQAAKEYRNREGGQAFVIVRGRGKTSMRSTSSDSGARYAVQAAACREKPNATYVMEHLKQKGYNAYVRAWYDKTGGKWYTVRIGSYASQAKAEAELMRYRANEGQAAFVVRNAE